LPIIPWKFGKGLWSIYGIRSGREEIEVFEAKTELHQFPDHKPYMECHEIKTGSLLYEPAINWTMVHYFLYMPIFQNPLVSFVMSVNQQVKQLSLL
jgi:hypothetical protein